MNTSSNPVLSLSQQVKDRKKIPYCKSEAIKYLEFLIVEAKRKKYPNIPPDYLAAVKYRDDTANSLTRCIIDFIRVKGGQSERVNCMGRPIDRTQTFIDCIGRERTIGSIDWIPGTGTKGSADISCCISGLSVKVEVKIGSDRMSQAQKDYQKAIDSAGGIYYIARNFTSFLEWYNLNF